MKTIWWLNHHATPPTVPGSTRHYSLARGLQKYGWRTLIINGSYDHLSPFFEEGCDFGASLSEPLNRNYDGVPFLSIPTPAYRGNASLGRIRNMRAFYKGVLRTLTVDGPYGKPDLVIGSTVHPWAALAGLKLARRFNVPFVYEVRDLWPLTLVELGRISRWHPLVLYFDWIDRILARSASRIITTAPLMKEYYKERWGLPEDKFLWVTNGTFTKAFETAARTVEGRGTFDIYYTGSVGLSNKLDELFDVLPEIHERFPKIRFIVVGSGPMLPRLTKRAQQERLPVIFRPPVPKKEVPALLEGADALMAILENSTIYRYGTSLNKIADYHAAGKPIIVIGKYGMDSLKTSGAGFLVEDIKLLPKVIERICSMSDEELKQMGERGRMFAREHYDWGTLAEKLNVGLCDYPQAN